MGRASTLDSNRHYYARNNFKGVKDHDVYADMEKECEKMYSNPSGRQLMTPGEFEEFIQERKRKGL